MFHYPFLLPLGDHLHFLCHTRSIYTQSAEWKIQAAKKSFDFQEPTHLIYATSVKSKNCSWQNHKKKYLTLSRMAALGASFFQFPILISASASRLEYLKPITYVHRLCFPNFPMERVPTNLGVILQKKYDSNERCQNFTAKSFFLRKKQEKNGLSFRLVTTLQSFSYC